MYFYGLANRFKDQFSETGYLLPVVIALGLGIGSVGVFAMQTLAQNSKTLGQQYYNQLANEAAQAGINAAISCVRTSSVLTGDSWDDTTLSPEKDCNLSTVPRRSPYVSDMTSDPTFSYTTTYTVAKPQHAPDDLTLKTLIISSTGILKIKGPGGIVVSTIKRDLHAFGTSSTSGGGSGYKVASQISVGADSTCTIAKDPAKSRDWAYCWGDNSNGQLGDGINHINNLSSDPVAVTDGAQAAQQTITGNACGGFFQQACAGAYPSGSDMKGKVVVKISSGSTHVCAVATDTNGSNGRAYCWGDNSNGQLGVRDTSVTSSKIPLAVDTGDAVPAQTSTPSNPCGGFFQPSCRPATPASSLKNKTITDVSAGDGFTCALASDQTVSCWGKNSSGQLGNSSRADSNLPVSVSQDPIAITRVCTNMQNGLFGPYCAAYNVDQDIPSSALAGKNVKTIARIQGTGSSTMCATDTTDAVYCWGADYAGQLGDGKHGTGGTQSGNGSTLNCNEKPFPIDTSNDALRPIAVNIGQKIAQLTISSKSVSTGTSDRDYTQNMSSFIVAKAAGTSANPDRLYTWGGATTYTQQCNAAGGNNGPGTNKHNYRDTRTYSVQLPNGPLYNNASANPLTINTKALALTSGNAVNGLFCALLSTNDLYCDVHGGDATNGQLGNNNSYICTGWFCTNPPSPTTPQAVTMTPFSGRTITAMESGDDFSCAIASDIIFCWGDNSKGQLGLGNNSTSDAYIPSAVDITAASALFVDPYYATSTSTFNMKAQF